MLGLSVYNMTVRENQMEKSLSLALSGAMNRYYEPNMYIVDKKPVSSYDVEKAVIEDINERLTAGGTAIATVYVCDMEKGIISAGIEEEFKLPTGVTKKISCKKTIVADQPMEDKLTYEEWYLYYSKNKAGGLMENSRWLNDPEFNSLLRQALAI